MIKIRPESPEIAKWGTEGCSDSKWERTPKGAIYWVTGLPFTKVSNSGILKINKGSDKGDINFGDILTY